MQIVHQHLNIYTQYINSKGTNIPDSLSGKHFGAMHGPFNIAEPISLDQVSLFFINNQASYDLLKKQEYIKTKAYRLLTIGSLSCK